MTKRCERDAVAAATAKKAPQEVVVKDFKSSEILNKHRPSLAASEQNRPDQGLVNVALGLERNLSSGPRCRFQACKANPSADLNPNLTSCPEGRAQGFEGLDLQQEYATKVDGVLCPEA